MWTTTARSSEFFTTTDLSARRLRPEHVSLDAHELVIVQFPEGATVEDALEGEIGFEEIFFVGGTYSEGGQPAPDLVLTGLEPGTYTIVCFIDIPDGIPHVARGMVATLTVE